MNEFDFNLVVKENKLLVLKTVGETLIDRFEDSIEDVVQEVFFRVYKALQKNQFDGRSKISTWIYTIAKNEANRLNQKRLREEEKAKRYLESSLFQSEVPDITLESEKSEWIQSILKKVPDKYKYPLALYLKGHSMEEIANELEMKEGTVKSKLFRAKEWIKKNIGGDRHEFQES
ncbi:MAG: RNA polymerase sigma factor [Leptospira sp.]|nr:RNA polymerase sigma factor [Leptospira sp.]